MTPPKVIALEGHFTSPKRALRGEKDTPVQRKLDDLGELRIREMDEAGIDVLEMNRIRIRSLALSKFVTVSLALPTALRSCLWP
ncbi:MAG: hypothetical protein WCD56_13370 [Pseudolabrys sp.]|jgi:hypothetical protein